MTRRHRAPDLLDMLERVIPHAAALTPNCEWIALAGRAPATNLQPGDRVTICTASRTYYVIDTHPDGTVDLRAAGETPGDGWLDYLLRVHATHCEAAIRAVGA